MIFFRKIFQFYKIFITELQKVSSVCKISTCRPLFLFFTCHQSITDILSKSHSHRSHLFQTTDFFLLDNFVVRDYKNFVLAKLYFQWFKSQQESDCLSIENLKGFKKIFLWQSQKSGTRPIFEGTIPPEFLSIKRMHCCAEVR